MSKKVAVVILNWNGKQFLEQFLPSVVNHSTDLADVYVADNGSTDDSLAFLEQSYPQVKRIVLDKNYGFTGGYNKALQQVESDYYVLLNSDVEVTLDWLSPMLNMMEKDASIAACQPKLKDFNKKDHFEYAGAAGGFLDKYGYPYCQGRLFDTLEKDEGQYNEPREIFWGSGASLMVQASLYHELGGLDEKFFAHMEEIDLCWRMKNLGYKIMYCPDSVVYHVGGGTLNKINPKKTYLNYKNNLLLLHKNLPKKGRNWLIFKRMTLDGLSGIKFIMEGRFSHCFAIFKAHMSFYRQMGQNKQKRIPENKANLSGLSTFSVVKYYFIKNVKTYSELPN